MTSPIERAIDKACGFNPNDPNNEAALLRQGTKLMTRLFLDLDGYYLDRTHENHDALMRAWEAVREHDAIMDDARRKRRAAKGGRK